MNFKSILAIGAHPDDLEFSCFGFLLKQRNDGANIHAFIASPDSFDFNNRKEERMKETIESFSLIPGSEVKFRNINDITYNDYRSISDTIRDMVIKKNIDLVLVHSSKDTMQEHKLLHDITLTALRRLPVSIFTYRSPSTYDFTPKIIIDISKEYQTKFNAIKKHKTQSDKPYMSDESIRIFNQSWEGKILNIDFSEQFDIIRIVDGRKQ